MPDTYRSTIRRLRRPYLWICVAAGCVLLLFLFASREVLQQRWAFYMFAACWIIWFASFIRLCNYIKCPKCRRNLPFMPTRDIPTYSTMNFCPSCGVNLDDSPGGGV